MRILPLCLALFGTISVSACTSETKTVRGPGASRTSGSARSGAASPTVPLARAVGISASVQVQSVILPLGPVPYNQLVLPLLSPDGTQAATQVGDAPDWDTLLAGTASSIPANSRIEIYAFDLRTDIEPEMRQRPSLLATVAEPVLLGRGADDEGFLVESPREDGSRWIGKASWKTGDIRWLVQDENVNAFAALGPAGRLAWSRRAVNESRFTLAVRGTGADWVMPAGRDWLFPIWANSGDRLFTFTIENGAFDGHYGIATTQATFMQTMNRLSISQGTNTFIAYQALSGQFGLNESPVAAPNQIVFFHPGIARMVLWRPLAPSGRRFLYLNAKSVAAAVDETDFALVATTTDLLRQNLRRDHERIDLVAGLQIPRPTSSETWPYLLLSPVENRVNVTALRLMPVE